MVVVVVGVRAGGRCNWSPKIMGQFGWRVIQGGMLVLNIRHQRTIGVTGDATSVIDQTSFQFIGKQLQQQQAEFVLKWNKKG